MSQPMGMADFFALEAGEYLERLDALLQGAGAPQVEELVRLARALRGSALMASQAPIARAAGGLEILARSVREGRIAWDPGTRQLATRAVDDLKLLVRHAGSWSEADSAKADALASQLEQSGGRPSGQTRAVEAAGLDAGARAFVAREGAAIASALDRAAQALRANAKARDPLQHVLRALQPLRGLAAIADLPPLPDLLDGVERAVGEATRGDPPADSAELFASAARAIAQAAREVAERGRPDPESADFRRFAERLVALLDVDAAVVPIEALYPDEGQDHVVRRGTAAARPGTLSRLELVSHGDHLRQAADSLERAPSATQRELRAHTLAGTFRALEEAGTGGSPLADAVRRFAARARDAVTSGSATRASGHFASQLRLAGEILAGASSREESDLATALDRVTAALAGERTSAAATAPAMAEEAPPQAETPDLAGSWATYQRLVAAGVGEGSLAELLAANGAAPAPDVVDIRTLLVHSARA